jgi:hypothetical protein
MLALAGRSTHLASTHFLATLLGKKKKSKIQSTSDMAVKGDDDKTNPHNQGNIIFPSSVDELPDARSFKPSSMLV